MGTYLDEDQLRGFYGMFGRLQDWQRVYEGPALRDLLRHADFEAAESVFEVGCGTGSFAEGLLRSRLHSTASYLGIDLSPRMVRLARTRLSAFGDRAKVRLTNGALKFDLPAQSFDRFVSNYVLDLLSPERIGELLKEAHRLLTRAGLLGIVGLTHGHGALAQVVSRGWSWVHACHPLLVGGCRPLELLDFVRAPDWDVHHRRVLSAFGVPSEVVVAAKV